jgi:benzoyl-CoA reductase subunit C
MVIPYLCDTTRNLFHTWNHRFPGKANEFLRLPKRLEHPGAAEYLRVEFRRFLEAMGNVTGKKVEEADLARSVKLYNRSRSRLRDAYRLQRERPSIWTAERVQLLLASTMRAPREDHLSWMEKLPWEIDQAKQSNGRIPVFVRGKVWDPPGILGLLEQLGLVIAGDDLVTGFRSIACDAPAQGDALEGLAKRLLCSPLYPGYHVEPPRMVSGFLEQVRKSGAQGVLFLNPKFCEAAGFDLPDLQQALQQAEVPTLVLETSGGGVPLGQIRVRLEAFREMLGNDLP